MSSRAPILSSEELARISIPTVIGLNEKRILLRPSACRELISRSTPLDSLPSMCLAGSNTWSSALLLYSKLKKFHLQHLLSVHVKNAEVQLQGAPQIAVLRTFYPNMAKDQKFRLHFRCVLGLNASWQRFIQGVAFPYLPSVLRPFYGVFAHPHCFEHYHLFHVWLNRQQG